MRLGLDYATLRSINPRLIYLFSSGSGSKGPRAHLQSFEPLQSGFCGLYDQIERVNRAYKEELTRRQLD